MQQPLIRIGLGIVALTLVASAPQVLAEDTSTLPASTADAMAQGASPQAIAEYQRKLGEYQAAREQFDAVAVPYWTSITEKRRGRNAKRRDRQQVALDDYVLTQPPLYSGPKRPVNPEPEEGKPRERKAIPVVADLLQAAAQEFQFTPQRPTS